jgi:hypothetical protein
MSHRAVFGAAAAVAVILLAGCGDLADSDSASDLVTSTSSPTVAESASPSPSPTPAATTAADSEEDAAKDREAANEGPAAAGDCAAYANSAGWCTNGIGDYDCEGGSGNGPNYAPRNVDVVEPGVDPFGLDRNNDGKGCEGPAPAAPAPPPPADPGTDPRFDTCAEAIDNGYGPYYRGQDPEYDWYRDADSDGVVCE